MPADGDAVYSTSSGAQLLEALDNIDGTRFPKNYAALRREIAARPAPGPTIVDGGEVIELARVPRGETQKLLLRVVVTLALLELGGSLVGMFVAIPLLTLIVRLVLSGHEVAAVSIGATLQVALTVGIAIGVGWAFLKWLLLKNKGPYAIRLIRTRSRDT